MSCDFKHCDPLEPGGCPCVELARNGGPLQQNQVAELLGITRARAGQIERKALIKLGMRKRSQAMQELRGEWPRFETVWDEIQRNAPDLDGTDNQAMSRHMTKQWQRLGWPIVRFNPAIEGDE